MIAVAASVAEILPEPRPWVIGVSTRAGTASTIRMPAPSSCSRIPSVNERNAAFVAHDTGALRFGFHASADVTLTTVAPGVCANESRRSVPEGTRPVGLHSTCHSGNARSRRRGPERESGVPGHCPLPVHPEP
jgi:hypothetical protein